MKKVTCIFYTFDEFQSLLRRTAFVNGELFEVEVVDTYFWRLILHDPSVDSDVVYDVSDFDALPELSKLVHMKLSNTHVSHDGIWLEGEEMLPKRGRR